MGIPKAVDKVWLLHTPQNAYEMASYQITRTQVVLRTLSHPESASWIARTLYSTWLLNQLVGSPHALGRQLETHQAIWKLSFPRFYLFPVKSTLEALSFLKKEENTP